MLSCQRERFTLPDDVVYLNCAYMSPLLRSVQEAGMAGIQRKAHPWSISPEDFFTGPDALRVRFGELINAPAERIALVPAVSYGVAIAHHNVSLRRGQNVVLPGEEFPSNVYAWKEACAAVGAELRIVERPQDAQAPGARWNERMLEAIDEDTAAVTLTAVHWTDGTLFELQRIGSRAREVGALYIVDGTQSIGARPFDWAAVQPDLLLCAGYKWLLGPYQLGFAVLGDRLVDAKPFELNWISYKNSEDFSRLIDYQDEYQPGAQRFDAGERSNPITIPMLHAALGQILAWGVGNIAEYCAGLGTELGRALGESEYILSPEAERSAHLFGVRVPDESRLPKVLEHLKQRQIHVSLRGTSVRVAPHVYNRPEDLHALAEALLAAR